MTKIIANCIRNVTDIHWHTHDHTLRIYRLSLSWVIRETWTKYHDNQLYCMHTLSMSGYLTENHMNHFESFSGDGKESEHLCYE